MDKGSCPIKIVSENQKNTYFVNSYVVIKIMIIILQGIKATRRGLDRTDNGPMVRIDSVLN